MGRFIIWSIRQKRRIKNGDSIVYISRKSLKTRIKVVVTLSGTALCCSLLLAILALCEHEYGVAIQIATLFFVFFGGVLFFNLSMKRGYRRETNILITVLATIGVLLFIFSVFVIFNAYSFSWPDRDSAGMSVISSSKTFLAGKTEYRCTLGFREDDEDIYITDKYITVDIFITVFESPHDWIMNWYQYGTTHRAFLKNYEEEEPSAWEAKAVYKSYNRIYIVYDHCVVSFSNAYPVKKEQIEGLLKHHI
jgi:amino acid transporter